MLAFKKQKIKQQEHRHEIRNTPGPKKRGSDVVKGKKAFFLIFKGFEALTHGLDNLFLVILYFFRGAAECVRVGL